MTRLTVDELRHLMCACVGGSGTVDLETADLHTQSFEDLDFDSLARVELVERLRDSRGIGVADDVFEGFAGPGDLLAHINTEPRE